MFSGRISDFSWIGISRRPQERSFSDGTVSAAPSIVLSLPALSADAAFYLPVVIVLSFVLTLPIAWTMPAASPAASGRPP
jgi:hypothetical protein